MFRHLLLLMTLPAHLAHEATHAVAAWPAAEALDINRSERRVAVLVDWRPTARGWQVTLAALAPTLVGIAGGAIGLAIIGLTQATGPGSAARWALVAGYWLVYVWPSRPDRSQARYPNKVLDHE